MGRELRRREERKSKNKKETLVVDENISVIGGAKIVGAVLILLLSLYFVIAVFITKEINIITNDEEVSENSDQESGINDKILAANIFKQKEEEYYVYFYDFDDVDASASSAVSSIRDKIYRVDTSSSLNSNYVSDDTNRDASNIDELKVKAPTLIKISNDNIVSYYEGANEIVNALK